MSTLPIAHEQQAPLQGGMLWVGGIVLALANFVAVLNMTIANVTVPECAGDIGHRDVGNRHVEHRDKVRECEHDAAHPEHPALEWGLLLVSDWKCGHIGSFGKLLQLS